MILNYEWRDADVPHLSAMTTAVQRDNARAVADNLGDRVSVQLTWTF